MPILYLFIDQIRYLINRIRKQFVYMKYRPEHLVLFDNSCPILNTVNIVPTENARGMTRTF